MRCSYSLFIHALSWFFFISISNSLLFVLFFYWINFGTFSLIFFSDFTLFRERVLYRLVESMNKKFFLSSIFSLFSLFYDPLIDLTAIKNSSFPFPESPWLSEDFFCVWKLIFGMKAFGKDAWMPLGDNSYLSLMTVCCFLLRKWV